MIPLNETYRPEVRSNSRHNILWFAMVAGHPSEIRDYLKKSSALLVAEMASEDLSVESAILMLRTLRKEERAIFKTNAQPQLMSDKRFDMNKSINCIP